LATTSAALHCVVVARKFRRSLMEESDTLPAAVRATFKGFAFANVTTVMVLEGGTVALYGPLVTTIAARFHVSVPEAGLVLSVHFVGAIVGVPIGWLLLQRLRGRVIVSGALVCLGCGAVALALAAWWGFFLAGAFFVGLGFGALSMTLSTFLTRSPLLGKARRISIANAGYAVGSVVGPLMVVVARPHNFRLIFAVVAVMALVLSALNRGLIAPPHTQHARQLELDVKHVQRRAILITFIAAYVLYVATESAASGWIASQLHGEGYTTSMGSLVTGGFWLGLALGRTMGGPLHRRFSETPLVVGGLVAAVVLSVVAVSGLAAPYVYPLVGLALSSVYPMGLLWYTRLCPHDSDGLAMVVFFLMAGGILGPGLESVFVSLAGVRAVPVVIAALAALDVMVFSSARRFALPVNEG
jgi:fucose permease